MEEILRIVDSAVVAAALRLMTLVQEELPECRHKSQIAAAIRPLYEIEAEGRQLHIEHTAEECILPARLLKDGQRHIKLHILLAKRLEKYGLFVKAERITDLEQDLPNLVADLPSPVRLVRETMRLLHLAEREGKACREIEHGRPVLRRLVVGFELRAIFLRVGAFTHGFPKPETERILLARVPSQIFLLLHGLFLPFILARKGALRASQTSSIRRMMSLNGMRSASASSERWCFKMDIAVRSIAGKALRVSWFA